MEAILGTIVGFVAFGIVWFFLLKPKNNQAPNDELKIKEEELKKSQIDLATREAEIKAAIEAKFRISEVVDLNGATSIGKSKPINNGPINFAPPNVFINLVDIAALCNAGIINILALPTILENG